MARDHKPTGLYSRDGVHGGEYYARVKINAQSWGFLLHFPRGISYLGLKISNSQIWISPIVKNINGSAAAGEGYHGFWSQDITQVNPYFGTPDDLKQLSQALHDRGMVFFISSSCVELFADGKLN